MRTHCNLRPPEPRQPFPALITTLCQVWRRWTYPLPYYSVSLVIHYFAPWPWPSTFDLEHLQRIVCDVMKLCTKFERNRTIMFSAGWIYRQQTETVNVLHTLW